MPNHVTNTLEIHAWADGDRGERIAEIKELLAGEEGPLDFNTIVPQTEEVIASLNWDLSSGTKQPMDWYDWRCKNWGTKWNAYDVDIDEDMHTIIYKFTTAWSPPEPFIKALREYLEAKYPDGDLFVNGMWVEEGYQSAGVF